MQNDIELYWVTTDSINPADCDHAQKALSVDEIDQADRFHHFEDRRDYVIAHALTRVVLGQKIGSSPNLLTFSTGPFGKPKLDKSIHKTALEFNLSHTRGKTALILGGTKTVGVDVEFRREPAPLDIAKQCFTDPERRLIDQTDPHKRASVFYDIWTLKEAYMKGTGLGMQLNLDHFAVAHHPPGLLFSNTVASLNWKFALQDCGPDYSLALAVGTQEREELEYKSLSIDPKWILRRCRKGN